MFILRSLLLHAGQLQCLPYDGTRTKAFYSQGAEYLCGHNFTPLVKKCILFSGYFVKIHGI